MAEEIAPLDPSSERLVELVPVKNPAAGTLHVVGPGRKERAYLLRLAALESLVETRELEIETAGLVERGSARRLDRMERKLAAVREAACALEQREHRLILALGAVQRENEILREKLALSAGSGTQSALPSGARGRAPARSAPAKRSWLARLVRRA